MKPLLVALATLIAPLPACAQDVPPATLTVPDDTFRGDSVTIGGAAVYLPDYEGSGDYRFTGAPGAIGSVGGFGFVLAGNRLSVDLIPGRSRSGWNVEAGPVGLLNLNRTAPSLIDDPRIAALGRLRPAIELGGYVGVSKTGVVTSPYDRLGVSLSYRVDVNGVHAAGILQPTVTYFTPLSRTAAVGLFASAERAERGYGRAYFDISGVQAAASGLPVFTTEGGWKNWSLGALGTKSLTGDLLHGLKIVGAVNYRQLLGDFADSPVVSVAGSSGQWLGALGLAYTF